MAKMSKKSAGRVRRKKHIRKNITGTAERPRLCVFRSSKHIYAQIIDDVSGVTLVSASSLGGEFTGSGSGIDGASVVGKLLGARAKASGVERVAFDRNGYRYHGRVAAFADGARAAGLEF